MKTFIEQVILWRLAIVRFSLFAFVGGATAWTTSMSGLEWSSLTGTQKWGVMFGVFIVMANNAIAFLDRTMARIAAGEPPVETDEKIKI